MSHRTGGETESLSEIPDRILVERAVDQDADAFGEIIRRHSPLMRAYVSRMMGSLTEADDVVQDALVTAWRQLHTLRDPGAVRAWLVRIAGREALAQIKRRPPDTPLDFDVTLPGSTQPEAVAIRNAQLKALSEALNSLPEDQRRCWLLREIADLSYAEIAEEMDIPASTVRGTLSRARSSITIQMEGWR